MRDSSPEYECGLGWPGAPEYGPGGAPPEVGAIPGFGGARPARPRQPCRIQYGGGGGIPTAYHFGRPWGLDGARRGRGSHAAYNTAGWGIPQRYTIWVAHGDCAAPAAAVCLPPVALPSRPTRTPAPSRARQA